MGIRCLMRLDALVPTAWGSHQAMFSCTYDQSLADEGKSFQKATPTGSASFMIDNPLAIEQLMIGAYYYLDFSPRDMAKK
ncbi:MAG: hypothetical protein KGJ90_00255 [Patescibacteria group bacterium]|nr:hypothetical protein [Patescibacteria group bacterium]